MKPDFMNAAIRLALENIEQGHGPFGAVVVKNGNIVGMGTNRVTSMNDPTAHAEISAIRNACEKLATFCLSGLEIYTSCEPCPMCLGAIYWARLDRIYYAATRHDAAKINFDDYRFYEELNTPPESRAIPMKQIMRDEALSIFSAWEAFAGKIHY